ncbi:type III effector protein [Paraburkholderia sp. JPY419]|uniref:type III effector protein n=1 Tax=Paraburkholderia sp. JPY419 TaxID=667660 RepID=UPI003D24A38C
MKIERRINTHVEASASEVSGDAPPADKLRRTSSAGVLQELDELNAARSPEHQEQAVHRRRASFSETIAAPALHKLIGRERAGALDALFGSLQPPFNLATDGIKQWEREGGVPTGAPLQHSRRLIVPDGQGNVPSLMSQGVKEKIDIDALKRGEKQYMWAVSALGRLFIGELEPAGKDPETQRERYRGHPLLVGGGTARICGELRFNPATGKFVVSNQSGRYSRYEDRTEAGLNEVASMFAQAGLDVETEQVAKYMTARKRATLILPSLDPRRC